MTVPGQKPTVSDQTQSSHSNGAANVCTIEVCCFFVAVYLVRKSLELHGEAGRKLLNVKSSPRC